MKLDSGILQPPRLQRPEVVGTTTMDQTNGTSSSSTSDMASAASEAKEASIAVINSTTETEMTSTTYNSDPEPVLPSVSVPSEPT